MIYRIALIVLFVALAGSAFAQEPTPIPTPRANQVCAVLTLQEKAGTLRAGRYELTADNTLLNSRGRQVGSFFGQSPNGSLGCYSYADRPKSITVCPESENVSISVSNQGADPKTFIIPAPYFIVGANRQSSLGYNVGGALLNANKRRRSLNVIEISTGQNETTLTQRRVGRFKGLCNSWQ